MRIAVALRKIAFDDGVGGMERAAAQHIEMMRASGHEVILFAPNRFVDGAVPAGLTVIDVPWPSWNRGTGTPIFGIAYALWVRTLAASLTANASKYDILHLHGASAGTLKFLTATTPTVVNPHGMEEFARSSFSRLPNRLVLRRMGREGCRADAVIATDVSLVAEVARNIGARSDRIKVIPNSVDIATLQAMGSARDTSQPFTIVSVGRMVRNKGYDLLLEALQEVETRAVLPTNWVWVHFGSGSDAESITARAAAEPRIPLTVLSGRSDEEVQGRVSTADLFIQPSRHEGSSLTTLEAMAHGLTIVATPVGGIPDKIRHRDTGYLATSATAADIAFAIREAVTSPEGTGERARSLVESTFSATAAQTNYLRLYRDLVSKKTKGAS
jgi:glycogen(starch) synthase